MFLAGVLYRGKHVSFGKRDKRIRLVVFEVGVEKGAVLIDEVFLKHQRFVLVFHHDVIKAVDLIYKKRDFRTIVLEVYVLAHSRAQLFRLADVYYLAMYVFP